VGVALAADRQSCCLDEVESACAGVAVDMRSKGATENAAPASSADPEGGVALADRLFGTITEDANGGSERDDSTSENPLHSS
jgi:hypothetical protein